MSDNVILSDFLSRYPKPQKDDVPNRTRVIILAFIEDEDDYEINDESVSYDVEEALGEGADLYIIDNYVVAADDRDVSSFLEKSLKEATGARR